MAFWVVIVRNIRSIRKSRAKSSWKPAILEVESLKTRWWGGICGEKGGDDTCELGQTGILASLRGGFCRVACPNQRDMIDKIRE